MTVKTEEDRKDKSNMKQADEHRIAGIMEYIQCFKVVRQCY